MADVWTDSYVPTAKQTLFHQSIADEVLYGGAAGGGKSRAIVQDGFARCMDYPGASVYMFRRTYPELDQTLIKEGLRVIPPGLAKFSLTRREFVFQNGSKIRFCHCETEKDLISYQGAEIDFLYFDELTHFTKAMYDYLKTRLRSKKESGIKADLADIKEAVALNAIYTICCRGRTQFASTSGIIVSWCTAP